MTAPAVQTEHTQYPKPTPERSRYTAFENGVLDQIQESEKRLRKEIKASEGRLCERIDEVEKNLKADIKKITDHLGID